MKIPQVLARGVGRPVALAVALAGAAWAQQAQASEGGASLYLLGSGGPGAAIMPPLKGVFLDNEVYYYSGSAKGGKAFTVGGNVVAGLDATIVADFATVLWAPTTNFAGGTLALGGSLPVGEPDVDVSAVLSGPLGNQIGLSASDSKLVIGDPIATAALGWKNGDWHIQVSTIVNIPIGDYREGQLANLAFHRWAGDASLAASWHEPKSGWDVTAKAGFTFNGKNDVTDYTTGTEFHLEAAIEKTLSPKWSAGLQAYYFDQVSGDSGAGATLGAFKGQVTGAGATVAYSFAIGKMPATLRFRALTEFDAKNRLEGDSLWLGLSVPLSLQMPSGVGGR
jgi:hypothetical protein